MGSRANGPTSLADREHEGHSGWRIDEIAASADGWLATHRPEVVLLLIGTNDMIQNYSVSTAPQRLSAVIDQIIGALPSAAVMVSSLPPLSDPTRQQRVLAYNAAIPGIVKEKIASGKRVRLVDMHPAIALADLADGVHPSAAGYNRMSVIWHEALRGVLGAAPADAAAPAAPAGLTATAGDRTVSLTWAGSASEDVVRYDVYRSSEGVRTKVSAASQGTSPTFTDTGLTNGTTYSYVVRAGSPDDPDGHGHGPSRHDGQAGEPDLELRHGHEPALRCAGAEDGRIGGASADTMAKQASPNSTFGSATTLRADGQELSTTGSAVKAYLRFEIPALATGESISSATLRLRASNGSANGPALYRTDAGWPESTLTWNGAPARTSSSTVANFGSVGTGTKTIAISGVSTSGTVSLELAPETADSVQFDSREVSTTGNRPQLVLTILTGS